MRLTGKVYLVGGSGYGYSAFGDCNMYMVDCSGKLALIDTGGGRGVSKVLENVRGMGFDPGSIDVAFITHCHYDHIGGNMGFKEATGCRIAAHGAEVEDIESLGELTLYQMARESGLSFEPAKVDMVLEDGQKVRVGDTEFTVVHTPGHSPGGLCFTIEENGVRNLFSGDTASADGRMGFINGPGYDHDAWKSSIEKLLALKPDRIFPGHGVFCLSGAEQNLKVLHESWNAPWQVTPRI